jgi:hypothetical protein
MHLRPAGYGTPKKQSARESSQDCGLVSRACVRKNQFVLYGSHTSVTKFDEKIH